MLQADVDRSRRSDAFADEMAWIPGGAFRMGSDRHYPEEAPNPEEAPSHRAAVDGFGIDRTPVTNRHFKAFVNATGHVTARHAEPVDTSTSHVGFRCVSRRPTRDRTMD
jgi:formylglycine-generating enzyme required for sulfatase activity